MGPAPAAPSNSHARLMRSAYSLVVNVGLNAVLGLAFWVFAAHHATQDAVGAAAATISVVMLLSTIGQANLGSALFHFLPDPSVAHRLLLRRVYAVAGVLSGVLAAFWVVASHLWRTSGDLSGGGLAGSVFFGVCVVLWSAFALQDSALTALGRATWVPIENAAFGSTKLLIVVGCVGASVSLTGNVLVTSFLAPMILAVVIVNVLLWRRVLRHRNPVAATDTDRSFRAVCSYAARDAVSAVFGNIINVGLPILVAARLGHVANARFYSAFIVFYSADLLTQSMATSLRVEAVREGERTDEFTRTIVIRVTAVAAAATLALIVGAPLLGKVLGESYAGSVGALRILALSLLPRGLVGVRMAILRVHDRLRVVAIAQVAMTGATLLGAWLLARSGGINGVAEAVALVSVAAAAVTAPWILRMVRARPHGVVATDG